VCTLTIRQAHRHVLLTMNRDEALGRGAEIPPALLESANGGALFMAPLDGPSGGTWIGVNQHGVVACLINGEAEEEGGPAPVESRGKIIPQLLAQGDFREAIWWLGEEFRPEGFKPFTLLVATAEQGVAVTWQGNGEIDVSEIEGEWFVMSSSSWNREGVLNWRRGEFEKWIKEGAPFRGRIPSLHLLQPDGLAEWSPLMARATAATRSITQVELNPASGVAALRYWPMPANDPEKPNHEVYLTLKDGARLA